MSEPVVRQDAQPLMVKLVVDKKFRTHNAVKYIVENYHQKIFVKKLASLCYMSESNFSRVFPSEHGVTAQGLIKRYRIEVAKNLLYSTQTKISYIARKTGFQDVSYFVRTFKSLTGKTPSEFRENILLTNTHHVTLL